MTEGLAERPDGLDGMVHDRCQLDSVLAEFDLTPTNAADVKKVVDLAYHVPNLPVEDFGRRSGGLCIALIAEQDLDGVADGGQGVAEFVGQHRQEFVFTVVGLAQRFFGERTLRHIGKCDYTRPQRDAGMNFVAIHR